MVEESKAAASRRAAGSGAGAGAGAEGATGESDTATLFSIITPSAIPEWELDEFKAAKKCVHTEWRKQSGKGPFSTPTKSDWTHWYPTFVGANEAVHADIAKLINTKLKALLTQAGAAGAGAAVLNADQILRVLELDGLDPMRKLPAQLPLGRYKFRQRVLIDGVLQEVLQFCETRLRIGSGETKSPENALAYLAVGPGSGKSRFLDELFDQQLLDEGQPVPAFNPDTSKGSKVNQAVRIKITFNTEMSFSKESWDAGNAGASVGARMLAQVFFGGKRTKQLQQLVHQRPLLEEVTDAVLIGLGRALNHPVVLIVDEVVAKLMSVDQRDAIVKALSLLMSARPNVAVVVGALSVDSVSALPRISGRGLRAIQLPVPPVDVMLKQSEFQALLAANNVSADELRVLITYSGGHFRTLQWILEAITHHEPITFEEVLTQVTHKLTEMLHPQLIPFEAICDAVVNRPVDSETVYERAHDSTTVTVDELCMFGVLLNSTTIGGQFTPRIAPLRLLQWSNLVLKERIAAPTSMRCVAKALQAVLTQLPTAAHTKDETSEYTGDGFSSRMEEGIMHCLAARASAWHHIITSCGRQSSPISLFQLFFGEHLLPVKVQDDHSVELGLDRDFRAGAAIVRFSHQEGSHSLLLGDLDMTTKEFVPQPMEVLIRSEVERWLGSNDPAKYMCICGSSQPGVDGAMCIPRVGGDRPVRTLLLQTKLNVEEGRTPGSVPSDMAKTVDKSLDAWSRSLGKASNRMPTPKADQLRERFAEQPGIVIIRLGPANKPGASTLARFDREGHPSWRYLATQATATILGPSLVSVGFMRGRTTVTIPTGITLPTGTRGLHSCSSLTPARGQVPNRLADGPSSPLCSAWFRHAGPRSRRAAAAVPWWVHGTTALRRLLRR